MVEGSLEDQRAAKGEILPKSPDKIFSVFKVAAELFFSPWRGQNKRAGEREASLTQRRRVVKAWKEITEDRYSTFSETTRLSLDPQ